MAFISTGTPAIGTGGAAVSKWYTSKVTRNYSPDTSLTQVQTFSSASFAHAVQTVGLKVD